MNILISDMFQNFKFPRKIENILQYLGPYSQTQLSDGNVSANKSKRVPQSADLSLTEKEH